MRVRYERSPYAYRSAGIWTTDLPDRDLNLSFRLQQMTSIKVDPDGRLLDLTEKELSELPFLYMVEPGGVRLTEAEVGILRKAFDRAIRKTLRSGTGAP